MDLALFEKQYNVMNYHCVHFLIDAAQSIFGQDYSTSFIGLQGALNEALSTSRQTIIRNKRLKEPQQGCIVLMTSPTGDNHVGLFYCDKVLHLTESGVQYVSIRSLKNYYLRFRYYEHVNHL
ncbi:hypothetical protein [Acinetobacter johnsonii]|uniref:hypothetical protein n=1 Tax=Acinetobacter johnsonii TaxID=40214 RepID=UPI003019BB9F